MAQYHISKNGESGICKAPPGKCPLGADQPHFKTQEEAQEYIESSNSEKFGSTSTVTKKLKGASSDSKILKEFVSKDFNPNTAEPSNFDEELSKLYNTQAEYMHEYEVAISKAHSKYDQRERVNGRYHWSKTDDEVMKEAAQDPSSGVYDEILSSGAKVKRAENAINLLNKKFEDRGSWNRAFLATSGEGHVHSGTNCSTCNKGKTPTQFQWMTQYSGNSENGIVKDAGYRACTVCYPSAPVGNANTLPTKMFSKEEEEKQKEREARKVKNAEKVKKAHDNAPTLSGEPLKIDGEYFKTERTAITHYSDCALDLAADKSRGPDDYAVNPDFLKERRRHSYQVLKSLAEKRDVSIKEMQEELRPKVETKIKKWNKDRLNRPAYISPEDWKPGAEVKYYADDFGLSEEKYNSSPRTWTN